MFIRVLICVILLNFTLQSKAQNYIPFPSSEARWVVHTHLNSNGDPSGSLLFTDAVNYCMSDQDTMINNQVYSQLNICETGYFGAIRDNGGQVYIVPKDESSEYLVYDFTLGVGDTLHAWIDDGTIEEYEVVAIDSVLIDGHYRKKMEFFNGTYATEGIGGDHGLFKSMHLNLSGIFEKLVCMSVGDTSYFPSLAVGKCDISIPTALDEIEQELAIKAFPNPSKGNVTIQNAYPNLNVEVYNLQGREVASYLKVSQQQEILMDGFAPGIYVFKFKMNDLTRFEKVILN